MEGLDGRNEIEKFLNIANLLKSKISSRRGVAGIIFAGGLTRGFADKHSDIDILVLLNEKNEDLKSEIQKIGKNEQRRSGVDVDLEVHFFEDFSRKKWDEMAKWDFSHSEIVFDPEKKVQELFKKRLRVSKSSWIKQIVVCGEYARWYCCSSCDEAGTIAEAWVERGDLMSAHYCLNYSIGLIVRMIFALNKEFLPPPKWEIFYSYTLKWLPANYERLVGDALTVRNLSKHELDRRLMAIRQLWREILPKIAEETGLTPELMSKQYANQILGQGSGVHA